VRWFFVISFKDEFGHHNFFFPLTKNHINWSIAPTIKIKNFGHPPPNRSMDTQNKIIKMVLFVPLSRD
jgi:hypothetical protein